MWLEIDKPTPRPSILVDANCFVSLSRAYGLKPEPLSCTCSMA